MMIHTTRNTFGLFSGFGVFLVFIFGAGAAVAQPSNLEVYQRLAVECVGEVELPAAVAVDAEAANDYLRAAIISHLIESRRRVYEPGAAADSLAVLRLRNEAPALTYSRAGRAVARDASLTLHLTLTMADGRVGHDSACRRSFSDVVERRALERIADAAYPETQAPAPPASWRRRYLEPVIMAGATAVTVLLFFSLRSKRAADE